MRLRTFTASDIHGAMSQVRDAMGDEAVIISTTRDPAGKSVTVTAASDSDEPFDFGEDGFDDEGIYADEDDDDEFEDEESEEDKAGLDDELVRKALNRARGQVESQARRTKSSEERYKQQSPALGSAEAKVFVELKAILAYHSVSAQVTDQLLETAQMLDFEPDATFEGIRKALAKVLNTSFQFIPLPLSRSGFRIMLIGPPGVGKTMTIAKIAAQLTMEKRKVTVISTDTKRAGGIEQLQAFTDILNLDLKVAENRTELRAILDNCTTDETIIIDSAGTNPYDSVELKDLGEFLGVGNVEPVLTVPAGGDPQEASHIAKAFGFTNARRLLFTRADLSRRYGSIIAAAAAGELAFCNSSSSSKVIGEYRPVDANYLSSLLMQYRLEN